MKRYSPISQLVCLFVLFVTSAAVLADWSPGDDHKMHDAQLPDKDGWDICLVHQGITDDFKCRETGAITDIHFWVSWKGDLEDFDSVIWNVSICENLDNRPGRILWTLRPGNGKINYKSYGVGDQGWHCPATGIAEENDHKDYYQVNITEIDPYFEQTKDERYWLLIEAYVGSSKGLVGWKTSKTTYHEKAYWLDAEGKYNLIGGNVYDLAFVITSVKATEIDRFNFSEEVELVTPLGKEFIDTSGAVTMHVFFEGPDEGDARDDDGDGFDEVELEIIDFSFTGTSPLLGEVELREHPSLATRGLIKELLDLVPGNLDVPPFAPAGNQARMDVDFYFEVEFDGKVLYTNQPLRLNLIIDHKPPGLLPWFSLHDHLPLIYANGNPARSYIALGTHWQGPTFEVDPFQFTRVNLEILKVGSPPEVVELTGFSSMYVLFAVFGEGYCGDGDGDDLEDADTEMAALDLTGSSPNLGMVHMRLAPVWPSVGEMEERINNTEHILDIPPFALEGSADSFFDMFFELEIDGEVLHNEDPLHWSQTIHHKPPKDALYEDAVGVPLYDENGNPSDYSVGESSYYPGYCGSAAHPIPIGDFNLDCRVNFLDLAIFALHWLECTNPVCP
ncbi:MAG: DUF7901 domain-containing protein [Planctomycetota bacterium]|jgi:hypothetical protein